MSGPRRLKRWQPELAAGIRLARRPRKEQHGRPHPQSRSKNRIMSLFLTFHACTSEGATPFRGERYEPIYRTDRIYRVGGDCIRRSGDVNRENVPSKIRGWHCRVVQVRWVATREMTTNEHGGPAKPLEGKFFDDRRCEWHINGGISRTISLVTRTGKEFINAEKTKVFRFRFSERRVPVLIWQPCDQATVATPRPGETATGRTFGALCSPRSVRQRRAISKR